VTFYRSYPQPRPGYTVPEFGGRLNGAEEDAAMLASVVADAQATQSIHREMIQRMSDWETREPGRLNTDDDLRNAFVANLEGLRSAFTDRTLQMVGVSFPLLLDRANPAHAVIVAVRDDLADTRDRLQAKKAQELVGKQVSEAKISLPEQLARTAVTAVQQAGAGAGSALEAGGKGLQKALETLAWVLGGGVALYLVTQKVGGK